MKGLIRLILFASLSLMVFVAGPAMQANAQSSESEQYFGYSCNKYQSSYDFVKSASLFCLSRAADSRSCMKQAKNYFRQCNLKGDFRNISKDIQRKILVMLLFTKSRDLAKSL